MTIIQGKMKYSSNEFIMFVAYLLGVALIMLFGFTEKIKTFYVVSVLTIVYFLFCGVVVLYDNYRENKK